MAPALAVALAVESCVTRLGVNSVRSGLIARVVVVCVCVEGGGRGCWRCDR